MECNEPKNTNKNSCLCIIAIAFSVFILLFSIIFINDTIAPNFINSYTFSEESVLIPADGLIVFDTNRVVVGDAISHTPGSDEFIINESGSYYVSFNISVFQPPEPGIAAILSVILQQNDVDVLGSFAGHTVSTSFQLVNLSFSVIIEADAGDVLTVINTSGIAIESLQPNINIIKLS